MKFREGFKNIFRVKDTPHRIALAFAIGVFMGISPFLGFHYIGAFAIAWVLRLNKLVAFVGVSVNNPWTIVPISTFCTWVGKELIGFEQILPRVDWKKVTLMNIISKLSDIENFVKMIKSLFPLIASFFVGSLVICTLSAVLSYFIIHIMVTRYQRIRNAS